MSNSNKGSPGKEDRPSAGGAFLAFGLPCLGAGAPGAPFAEGGAGAPSLRPSSDFSFGADLGSSSFMTPTPIEMLSEETNGNKSESTCGNLISVILGLLDVDPVVLEGL